MSVEALSSASSIETPEVVATIPENRWDRETDRQIEDFLSTPTFGNKVFNYSYDHRSYEVRIINNPEGKKDFSMGEADLVLPISYSLVAREDLPPELKGHLESLIQQKLGTKDGYVSMGLIKDEKNVFNILSSLTLQPTPKYDLKTEEQIRVCFKTKEFAKGAFTYVYKGQPYEILAINNPGKLPLDVERLPSLQRWSFVLCSSSDLPFDLRNRLLGLSPFAQMDIGRGVFEAYHIKWNAPNYKTLTELQPVEINVDGNLNSLFDAQMRECFRSTEFVNRAFYYRIGNGDYRVRIIHNPEKIRLAATYRFDGSEPALEKIWTYRYGVIADKEIPQRLVDRIASLANSSWWDWYTDFEILNQLFYRASSKYVNSYEVLRKLEKAK